MPPSTLNRSRRGFSLKELLIVVSILAVLSAIMMPALGRSRSQSFRATELSHMRQLGAAAHMYTEREGQGVLGTLPLVEARDVPKEICASPRDPSPIGMANEYVLQQPLSVKPTTYKNTYIGMREYNFQWDGRPSLQAILEAPGAGWLVNVVESRKDFPLSKEPLTYRGSYFRLLFDGSVVRRELTPMDCAAPSGEGRMPCMTVQSLFSDDRTPL